MRGFVVLLAALAAAVLLTEAVAVGGAGWLHSQARYDDEIAWLEALQPVLVWDPALDLQIGKLYRDRVRRELDQGRVDRAVSALRLARARARSRGEKPGKDLMALGIEAFTRAADRMEARGLLSVAAAWDDSLFVLAVRAPEPHHRYAALAAFMEGLDLRVRNGEPCAALARVEWARRGLGGQIPGFQPSVEEDLANQCRQARRHRQP